MARSAAPLTERARASHLHKTVGQSLLDERQNVSRRGQGFDWAIRRGTGLAASLPRATRSPRRDRTVRAAPSRNATRPRRPGDRGNRYYRPTTFARGKQEIRVIDSNALGIRGPRFRIRLTSLAGTQRPLVAWERSSVDSANGAQIMFDSSISSANASGCDVGPHLWRLAPTAFEGQGPKRFFGAPRTLPADVRRGQLDRRQLHDARQLLFHNLCAARSTLAALAKPPVLRRRNAPAPQLAISDAADFTTRSRLPPGAVD